MSYFEFPHTRSYDGDLGYVIKRIDELTAKYGEFMEYNQIKFADPVVWNINTVYPAWNIVFANNGYYIAVKPVPAGIMYNNTDYWALIIPFDVDTVLDTESLNPVANSPVARRFNNVSNSISNVVASLQNEGRQREEADEALRTDINANADACAANAAAISSETNARATADTSLSRDIETLSARVDNLAQTIVPGGTSGDAELADIRVGADGVTYPNAGDAVRTQFEHLYDVINNDNYLVTENDIAQGAWYSDGIHTQNNRICFNRTFTVKKGDKFVYGGGALKISYGLWVNGVLTDYHDWGYQATETTYIFEHDGEFFAQFSKAGDAAIIPSEYDFTCKIYYGIKYETDKKFGAIDSNIDALREQSGFYAIAPTLANGTPPNTGNTYCVHTSDYIAVEFGDNIEFNTDRPLDTGAAKYIYGVYGYDSSKSMIVNLSPTDRQNLTSAYRVDKQSVKYIKYAVTEVDSSNNLIAVRVGSFADYHNYVLINRETDNNFYDYAYYGEQLNFTHHEYNVLETNIVVPNNTTMSTGSLQGSAMYDGKVIQLYSNPGKLAIVDMSDSSVIATMDSNVGHGNTIDFFDEFDNAGDDFPLALVADGLTNEAYKIKIETSGVTVKETIKFPNSGYYISTGLDKLNNIIYTVGYYANSYTSDANNKMVISKWDYNHLTDNGDGTYTPELLDTFYLPFMTTLQGPTFYNGRFYVLSSKASSTEADTKLYVINPYEKRITAVLDQFNAPIKNIEVESIYFYDNDCYLRSSSASRGFYILKFN